MRFEETKDKNLDKICHLQSLLKEKKNEEQGIRVLRKGGEEWCQESGEAEEDTSGEHRVLAVFFVCGAGSGHEPILCAEQELNYATEENVDASWIEYESQHADQLMMNVAEAEEEEEAMEASDG
ncbi:uncharacterized protein MONOS_17058 [Monocercomonoides exilis]|uniref:uncharacterized protein n=1 Tax=Monocercomonoides exilis TaxID=2049356 RepID=UPI003559F001|nr:hypothetical protein MONOS_17058 [Monocercomonoides exilis]